MRTWQMNAWNWQGSVFAFLFWRYWFLPRWRLVPIWRSTHVCIDRGFYSKAYGVLANDRLMFPVEQCAMTFGR